MLRYYGCLLYTSESLSLGTHTLTFVLAPMVHWPEVMVSYESSEKVLFSADGFGRFGAVARFDENADWASEARRYYLNIVGKYGPQVQALLKKAAALDIATICPLHGPVLTGDLSKYLNYYDLWSSYKAEEPEKKMCIRDSYCCQLIFWRSLEQVPHCYPLPRPRSPRRNLYAPIKHTLRCG